MRFATLKNLCVLCQKLLHGEFVTKLNRYFIEIPICNSKQLNQLRLTAKRNIDTTLTRPSDAILKLNCQLNVTPERIIF